MSARLDGYHPSLDGYHPVAIGLGANLGPRLQTLRGAARSLEELLRQPRFSTVYETQPMYETDQPSFLNACGVGWTDLGPAVLLDRLQQLERDAGRRPGGSRYGPRRLDLDIVLYADRVVESQDLTIPHPRLLERGFVLLPLSEIAGPWIHPVEGLSIEELAADVDLSGVEATNLHLD